jgi:hypothetical protein
MIEYGRTNEEMYVCLDGGRREGGKEGGRERGDFGRQPHQEKRFLWPHEILKPKEK